MLCEERLCRSELWDFWVVKEEGGTAGTRVGRMRKGAAALRSVLIYERK